MRRILLGTLCDRRQGNGHDFSIHVLFLALSLLLQQQQAPSLESVLKKMDAAAASFHTAQADFVWDQYQKVVDETDTQKGTVYYRRAGNEIEMMAEIKEPDAEVRALQRRQASDLPAEDRAGHGVLGGQQP